MAWRTAWFTSCTCPAPRKSDAGRCGGMTFRGAHEAEGVSDEWRT